MTHLLDVLTSWHQLLPDSELCPLVMLIFLLIYLGRFAVANAPHLQLVGIRIAFGVTFVLAVIDLIAIGLYSPGEVLLTVIRALAAGGLILGASWISLPVIVFVFHFLQRICDTALSPIRRMRRAWQARRLAVQTRKQQRLANQEWERTRPERERAAREAAERARHETHALSLTAARQAAERTRREDALLGVLVVYDRRAAGQGERIPRQRIINYLQQYLSADQAIEVVEERSRILQQMLQETARGAARRSPFEKLDEIAVRFQSRRSEIAALSYDAETKETLLTSLNAQEEAAIREFLRP